MSAQSLRLALTTGVMQQQGSLVPAEKMPQLIEYLAMPEEDSNWTAGDDVQRQSAQRELATRHPHSRCSVSITTTAAA